MCAESLTEDDDLDDLGCYANGILHLKGVVSCVIDGRFTDDKVGVFAIAVNLNAVQAVLQFDAAKGPGADGRRFGLYGDVEVDWFATMHMDNLLRNVGHVDLGHHWNTQEECVTLIVCQLLSQIQNFLKGLYNLYGLRHSVLRLSI